MLTWAWGPWPLPAPLDSSLPIALNINRNKMRRCCLVRPFCSGIWWQRKLIPLFCIWFGKTINDYLGIGSYLVKRRQFPTIRWNRYHCRCFLVSHARTDWSAHRFCGIPLIVQSTPRSVFPGPPSTFMFQAIKPSMEKSRSGMVETDNEFHLCSNKIDLDKEGLLHLGKRLIV